VPESFSNCLIRASRAVPSAPVSEKPLASAVTTGTPIRAHSSIASSWRRRRDDISVLGNLRQSGERRPGALAQHLVAARIDRVDTVGISGLPQIFQRAAGGLGGVVGLADNRDRLGASSTCARRCRALSLPSPRLRGEVDSERSEEAG
jgi:hypothetical protein